jgi:hypothetical protein
MLNQIPTFVKGPYPDVGTQKLLEDFHTYLLELETLTDMTIKTLINDIRDKLKGDYVISLPGLAIGTTVQNVAHVAFDFMIGGAKYSKATLAAGTALAGDAVPQDTYGAWRLEIGANGTVDIIEAADNATGYVSAVLAVAGLPDVSADHASMGVVTAISTVGVFTPGATALDAADVTVVYTDGQTAFQAIGEAIA